MRIPQYISPSSLKIFFENREEYYLKYLADNKKPRDPQTKAMAVGSAFDAYVKSYLFEKFHGKTDPKFEFDTLFAQQVEEPVRDFALEAGRICYEAYRTSGALVDLLNQMADSPVKPMFEVDLKGSLGIDKRLGNVPLFGKPDLFFKTVDNVHVVYDWKVNGYMSKASPAPGYVMIRDGWKGVPSRGANSSHKETTVFMKGRIPVGSYTMDRTDPTWAIQTSIYAWMLGEPIGSDFIVGIDQLACDSGRIRIAEHRAPVGKQFQLDLAANLSNMWAIINSGHIFDGVSREQSDERCKTLDGLSASLEGEDLFRKMTT